MSNRSIAMFEYRQVILQMRSGESDRAISRLGWVSRTKVQEIRSIAKKNGLAGYATGIAGR